MKPSQHAQRGFSLIESLLSLLVIAIGMLAIASLHANLARSADGLRQRGEAMRLAQQAVDALRAGAPVADDADIAPAGANTHYARQSLHGGADSSAQVDIRWLDRTGQQQRQQISTQIPALDPAPLGVLAFGPAPTAFQRALRHQAVPPAAKPVDRGRSLLDAPGLPQPYLLSDRSGEVVSRCPPASSTTSACEDFSAYLVSGYIRFSPGVPEAGLRLDPLRPLTVLPSGNGRAPSAFVCSSTPMRSMYNAETGHSLTLEGAAAAPPGYTDLVERYIAYVCVVTPVDDDGQPQTPARWSGSLQLQPAGWRIGPDAYRVEALGAPTTQVTGSLDQQNFLVTAARTVAVP